MSTDTALSLAQVFNLHASLRIDTDTYNTNPMLRDLADRILAVGGFAPADVPKDGVTVYRSVAVFDVFEKTPDGKRIVRDGELVRRTVTVPLGDDL